jgi:hypothetical protein
MKPGRTDAHATVTRGAIFTLGWMAQEHLRIARKSSDGRSAISLHEGESSVLRQTLAALMRGQKVTIEHPPEEAWVLVLGGHVQIDSLESPDAQASALDLIRLPRTAHVITAEEDAVILLMVAKGERPHE